MKVTQLCFEKSYKGTVRAWCDVPALECTFDFEWSIFEDGHNRMVMTKKSDGEVLEYDSRSNKSGNLTEAQQVFLTMFGMVLYEVMYKFPELGLLHNGAELDLNPNITFNQQYSRVVPEIVRLCATQTQPQE